MEKMLTWNDTLTEAPMLPEKDAAGNKIPYQFEVTLFRRNPVRGFSNDAYKALSVDLKLTLTAEVDGETLTGTAEDLLILTVKSQFKIFQYFTAIGLRKKGTGNFDPVKAKAWEPNENLCKQGHCYIKIDEFNGQKRVKIDRYLEPEETGVEI